MASFFETLRRPKALSAWADDGRIRAGESDPYAFAKDFLMRKSREETNNRGYANPGGNIGRIARGQENTRPMNVVYNQGPEMAEKQFKFMKDQAALDQKNKEADRSAKALEANDDYIDNRRANEMKQRQMDISTDLALKKLAMELPEREKLAIEQQNNLARIAAQGENQLSVANLNNARMREIADENNKRAKEVADATNQSRIDATTIRANGNDKALSTNEKAMQLLMSDPRMADVIQMSEDGKSFSLKGSDPNSSIGPATLDYLRREAAKQIYGDRNTSLMSGLGSSSLNGNLGSAGASGNIAERGSPTASFQKGAPVQNSVVMMVAPDGRRLKVPAEKVAELEAAGAKRIQ